MKPIVCSLIIAALLFMLLPGAANAWDGNRQGFIFGGGLGGGATTLGDWVCPAGAS